MDLLKPVLQNEHFCLKSKYGRTFLDFDDVTILNPNKEYIKNIVHYQTGVFVTKTLFYDGQVIDSKSLEIYQFLNNNGKSIFEVTLDYEDEIQIKVTEQGVLVNFLTNGEKSKSVLFDYNGKKVIEFEQKPDQSFSM